MTTTRTEKSWELLELEFAATAVLRHHPQLDSWAAFRTALADYLREEQRFDDASVERALLDLDRGEIELPRALSFTRPSKGVATR